MKLLSSHRNKKNDNINESNNNINIDNNKSHSRSSSLLSHGSFHLSSTRNNITPSPRASPNNSSTSFTGLSNLSPLIFSKSTIPNLNYNNSDDSDSDNLSNENKRLEFAKLLDQSLLKFNNLKKNNTLKANILRLNLLPYLRFPIEPFNNLNNLLSTSLIDLNLNLLLYESNLLINWWTDLLNILLIDFNSILSTDRNCYFESISRLLSHNIWILFQFNLNYNLQFNEIYKNFKKLLLQTFEFAILKLNSKNLSISIQIFIGKIFSISFFHLNNISNGLSFLLNTKLINFKKIYNLCIFDSFNNLNLNFLNKFPNILNDISTQFPNHLLPLISSNIQPRDTNYIIESQFLNSIYPPREKIEGIRETKGIWVNRWSSIENISIFCSFFRNYLTLSSIYLKNFPLLMINEYYIFGMPGFLTFLTHIYQIFNLQLNNLSIKNSNNNNNNNNNNSKLKYSNNNIHLSDNLSIIQPPKISNESNIDKCFDILHDLLVNPRNPNEILLKSGVIKGYENILKLFFKKTNILDFFMIETLLNLFIKFLETIDIVNENNLNEMNESLIDWKFWLDILIRLLDSNNLNSETKSISTFYQIWDFVPNNIYLSNSNNNSNKSKNSDWISNTDNDLKLNLTNYLLSSKTWFKFFGHYMSFERNLYIKLIIWKIIGINDLVNLNNNTNHLIQSLINLRINETYDMTRNYIFKPLDLLMKKKFKIIKINNLDIKRRDKKLRTYPYEVLDDAIYTCSISRQSTDNNISDNNLNSKNSSSNNSIATMVRSSSINSLNDLKDSKIKSSNWLGKIFNKSQSSPTVDSTNNNNINNNNNSNTKLFGKLLNISKTSSDKRELNSPISSVSSSFSSLELNQSLDSKNNNNNSDLNSENILPPEWDYYADITKDNYKFILVDDEIKIQSFMKKLNYFNSNNHNNKYNLNSELLIINDKPRLPKIKLNKNSNYNSTSRINIDSLESIVNDGNINEFKNDEIFLGGEFNYNDVIDLNGGFDDFNELNLNNDINNNSQNSIYNTGTKYFYDGTNSEIKRKLLNENNATLMYLSNGLLEFNEEVVIFENFINDRFEELDYNDFEIIDNLNLSENNWNFNDTNNHNNNEDDSNTPSSFFEIPMAETIKELNYQSFKLTNKGFLKLRKDIPRIVPDIPGEKLNAY